MNYLVADPQNRFSPAWVHFLLFAILYITLNIWSPYHAQFYPPLDFCPENVICFLRLQHIFSSALQARFFMEAKNMNADQTAPLGAFCSGFTLFAIKATYCRANQE